MLGYLKPYRLRFSLGLLTTTLASLLDGVTLVILIPLLQQIFASAPPPGGGTQLETLVANVLSPLLTGVSPTVATVRLVLLLLVALVLKNALAYASGQISVQIQESLVRDLRTQLFDHLLRLDLGFFERTRSGQISSRVMQDADASKGVVSAGLASFFQNLVVIGTTLLVLTQISWRLTLLALAAAPVLLVTIRALLKRLRRYSRARADEAGEMTASVAERLGAVKLVRAFGGEERESKRFRDQASRYRQRTVRAQRLATLTAPLSELFGGFLLVFMLSGLMFPLSNIPAGLRWLSHFVWSRYYIEIVRDVFLQGGGWPAVWYKVAAIGGIGSLFFGMAWRRMRPMQLEV